eukprot:TRINITY_DN2118_c0_g1_i1.p2 TRINITY_DN2118_c0_g1~~TRINITY_DN2118_c0_g1_i1.p2  ORF type:complete len:105 (-),score=19.19 TRINITY_DN2118_c0_g1_i1:35-349(-)
MSSSTIVKGAITSINAVAKTYSTLKNISESILNGSTPAEEQRLLKRLLRRLECVIEPINYLSAWTNNKNSGKNFFHTFPSPLSFSFSFSLWHHSFCFGNRSIQI